MNVSVFSTKELHQAFGIEMSSVEKMSVGAGWGRVAPGVTSDHTSTTRPSSSSSSPEPEG